MLVSRSHPIKLDKTVDCIVDHPVHLDNPNPCMGLSSDLKGLNNGKVNQKNAFVSNNHSLFLVKWH